MKPQLLETLNFAIVERFVNLQEQQKKYLFDSFGDVIKLKHYDDISEVKLENAYVIANEIFDAFSCDLVYTNKDGILQQAFVSNHKIEFVDCIDEKIIEHCKNTLLQKEKLPFHIKALWKLFAKI